MTHDIHFLERLSRLSTPETELALGLYQDPDLVRFVLGRASVEEGAERVAISLGDDVRGPFVVVARDGHFVTCLAAGMFSGNWPVITRGQLDAIADRASELRGRIENARKLAGTRDGVLCLLDRIYTAGPWLTREEFSGIAALQPLMCQDFLKLLVVADALIEDVRRQVKRVSKAAHKHVDLVRSAWNLVWAVGHLSVLATMESREVFENPPPELSELRGVLSWPAVRQGVVGIAVRGAWGVGRVGKPLLGAYKASLTTIVGSLELLDTVLGLLAIGLRHARLAAEVRKALHRESPTLAGPNAEITRRVRDLYLELVDVAFDRPERAIQVQLDVGRRASVSLTGHLAAGDPNRYGAQEDVPDEIALTVAANSPVGFVRAAGGVDGLLSLFACLPWVARARPEDLYLPAAVVAAMRQPWAVGDALDLLSHYDSAVGVRAPVTAGPAPGRNDPCPCGSGIKYKRCCLGKDAKR